MFLAGREIAKKECEGGGGREETINRLMGRQADRHRQMDVQTKE